MDKEYVKIINGYYVKDEDARSDISDIQTSISGINESITSLNNSKMNKSSVGKVEITINSLVLTDFEDPTTLNVGYGNLPSGFDKNNCIIIGGEYFIYDTNEDLVGKMQINESFYSAKDTTSFSCSYGFSGGASQEVEISISNYLSGFVGYKVVVNVYVMKFESENLL